MQFVVNVTGRGDSVDECVGKGDCVVACDLNVTLPLSAALYGSGGLYLNGLVNYVGVEEIEVLSSEINISVKTLKNILNTLVDSFRPQINAELQQGIDISNITQLLPVQDLFLQIRKDHLFLGVIHE